MFIANPREAPRELAEGFTLSLSFWFFGLWTAKHHLHKRVIKPMERRHAERHRELLDQHKQTNAHLQAIREEKGDDG